jgi:hypothetical protein
MMTATIQYQRKNYGSKKGNFQCVRCSLGLIFDGIAKTMWLEDAWREKLLTVQKGWIRAGERGMAGIPFN